MTIVVSKKRKEPEKSVPVRFPYDLPAWNRPSLSLLGPVEAITRASTIVSWFRITSHGIDTAWSSACEDARERHAFISVLTVKRGRTALQPKKHILTRVYRACSYFLFRLTNYLLLEKRFVNVSSRADQ